MVHGCFLAEKNLVKIEAKQDSLVCLLRERYIMQIFQGIIQIPFINNRVNQLQRTEPFSHLQRRVILKIAFEMEELTLKIGSTIKLTQTLKDSIKRYLYFIVSGQIIIIREGKAVCMIGPTEMFGPDLILLQDKDRAISNNLVGRIATERATLYKIPAEALSQN